MKPNERRPALLAALQDPASAPVPGWERVPEAPGLTIRWMRELDTPDWAQEVKPLNGATWPDPRYRQRVFLTMVTWTGRPLLREHRAPWVSVSARDLTLTEALEILAAPAEYLDRL